MACSTGDDGHGTREDDSGALKVSAVFVEIRHFPEPASKAVVPAETDTDFESVSVQGVHHTGVIAACCQETGLAVHLCPGEANDVFGFDEVRPVEALHDFLIGAAPVAYVTTDV